MRFGSPPISLITSRIVARSTIAGTPVKSCISTRAGRNAISFAECFPDASPAKTRMSSAVTVELSSNRNRFSSMTFSERGRFDMAPAPAFSAFSSEKNSNSVLPTLNVDCELNVFIIFWIVSDPNRSQLSCHCHTEEFSDYVSGAGRQRTNAQHSEAAEEKVSSRENGNHASHQKQRKSADYSAGNKSRVSGCQEI